MTFAFYPLLMARGTLKREDVPVDRASLRRPFFLQCYFAGPLAITTSLFFDTLRVPELSWRLSGLAIGLVGGLWYLGAESLWFGGRLKVGRVRGGLIALKLTLGATLMGVLIGLVVFAPDLGRSFEAYRNGASLKAAATTVQHIETMP